MAHLLIVDDDEKMRALIRHILENSGFELSFAGDGQSALDWLEDHQPDLIILDIVMPGMNGVEVCLRIRANPYTAALPIIFLTSKEREQDVAECLDAGGDDFVNKGAIRVELPARIRALLRRMPGGTLDPDSEVIEVGTLRVHNILPTAWVSDREIALTTVEHRLLHFLAVRHGQPVSAERLLENVWEHPPGTGDNRLVRVAIGRLRTKIEPEAGTPRYVINVRGQGYLVQG